jgi:hypothetical protein
MNTYSALRAHKLLENLVLDIATQLSFKDCFSAGPYITKPYYSLKVLEPHSPGFKSPFLYQLAYELDQVI